MKKYELIKSDKVSPAGIPLFQVVALRDFGSVRTGDKGGYIESDANLSHEGNCWVFDDAQVYGTARVFDDAQVCDTARVCGKAQVFGNAQIFDKARVSGNARIFGKARIFGTAQVSGTAQIFDTAQIFGKAWIFGTAQVSGTALAYGNARIFRDTQITAGYAFATKDDSWRITEVNNGNGTSTLYADAVFEFTCDHVTGGVPDEDGTAMAFVYCPKCGEKL